MLRYVAAGSVAALVMVGGASVSSAQDCRHAAAACADGFFCTSLNDAWDCRPFREGQGYAGTNVRVFEFVLNCSTTAGEPPCHPISTEITNETAPDRVAPVAPGSTPAQAAQQIRDYNERYCDLRPAFDASGRIVHLEGFCMGVGVTQWSYLYLNEDGSVPTSSP